VKKPNLRGVVSLGSGVLIRAFCIFVGLRNSENTSPVRSDGRRECRQPLLKTILKDLLSLSL